MSLLGAIPQPKMGGRLLTASRRWDTLAGHGGHAVHLPEGRGETRGEHLRKLGLAPDDNDNRRVIAALRYLES